jgi:flavorubredoxin/NADPH-dependent 2,4-dienoyl-CoA reductase/sulfur reductase-like enzyme/rubredoxin
MANVKIKEDLYWVGVQDHELRVFDVIMETEFGTSYNAYLLKTKAGAILFETAKAKKMDIFLDNIKEVCELSEIKYIVIDHTEPDHTGSLEKLLALCPNAIVLGSAIALQFLTNICNCPIPGKAVTENDTISLGGYELNFISAPFLHWPDSMFTYIKQNKTLVTCDSFGCHYADDRVCNDLIEGDFVEAYSYYFNMIMGPFKKYVQAALKKIAPLELETICPGHGPVLRDKLDFYLDLYDQWSQAPEPMPRNTPKVTIAYVSAYGYTAELASTIATGISENCNAQVDCYDMVVEDHAKVLATVIDSDGIIFGTPTVNGDALPPVTDLVMQLNGLVHGGKIAGSFGSYGWSGEGADMLMARLNVLRMNTLEPPLKALFKPSNEELAAAYNYGKRFARKLKEEWVPIGKSAAGVTLWRCTVCGEVFSGALPPLSCTVCGAGPEAFIEYTEEIISFSSEREFKTVIIGSGAGAIYAADALRKRNPKVEIEIYSADEYLPYYRPALTKKLAEDFNVNENLIFPEQYYKANNIKLQLGTKINKIDPAAKTIYDTKGKSITYDKLIIATGAKCFVPPIKGANLPEVITLRNLTDFNDLKKLIANGAKEIVVMGGGLLGLEAADSLTKLGVKVTVIEMAKRTLPRQLDQVGSKMLQKIIDASETTMLTNVMVDEISGHDKVIGVVTHQGKQIPCDAVIISAGTKSNIHLAFDAGIEVARAIIVNDRMQTSHADIYAVGDCVEFNGTPTGLWEPAIAQGRIAGAHIAGENIKYEPPVVGATLHGFGTKIFSIGDIGYDNEAAYTQVNNRNEFKPEYRNLYFKDDMLVGGILLGDLTMTNQLLSNVKQQSSPAVATDNKLL